MVQRRYTPGKRRYTNPSGRIFESDSTGPDGSTTASDIPLPNVSEEDAPPFDGDSRFGPKPSFLDSFIKNIHIDDIIILGLIFLLLDENLEDDLLLILLVYILLTGR